MRPRLGENRSFLLLVFRKAVLKGDRENSGLEQYTRRQQISKSQATLTSARESLEWGRGARRQWKNSSALWVSGERAFLIHSISQSSGQGRCFRKVGGNGETKDPCIVSCMEPKKLQDLRKEIAALCMLNSPTEIPLAQRGLIAVE